MLRSKLPAGFVVPAQPVERAAPPSGADWVHALTRRVTVILAGPASLAGWGVLQFSTRFDRVAAEQPVSSQ